MARPFLPGLLVWETPHAVALFPTNHAQGLKTQVTRLVRGEGPREVSACYSKFVNYGKSLKCLNKGSYVWRKRPGGAG